MLLFIWKLPGTELWSTLVHGEGRRGEFTGCSPAAACSDMTKEGFMVTISFITEECFKYNLKSKEAAWLSTGAGPDTCSWRLYLPSRSTFGSSRNPSLKYFGSDFKRSIWIWWIIAAVEPRSNTRINCSFNITVKQEGPSSDNILRVKEGNGSNCFSCRLKDKRWSKRSYEI